MDGMGKMARKLCKPSNWVKKPGVSCRFLDFSQGKPIPGAHSQDSPHRDPESVSQRRAKGAKGPSPWTTVTTAYTYVGAAMELLGHIFMRPGVQKMQQVMVC